MKRLGPFILLIVLLTVVLLVNWGRRAGKTPRVLGLRGGFSANPSPTVSAIPGPKQPTNPLELSATIVRDVFNTPIAFFGKVEDQNGLPILDARIQFSAIDKFWESGSKFETHSNADGLFSITGIKGAGLTVGVSKKGYDGINGLSYQSFGYGMPPDSTRKAPPSKEAPARFVLRKKATADSLFVVHRDILVPKNGMPVEVSLRTGKPVKGGQGDLKLECWTSDERKDAKGHYEWHARVSVPGGGMTIRSDTEREFSAPEMGYIPITEIATPQASIRWRPDYDADYWVKLHDQTFARIRLRITTAGDHFATIESYLNPSGSRNLEYDEAKVIK